MNLTRTRTRAAVTTLMLMMGRPPGRREHLEEGVFILADLRVGPEYHGSPADQSAAAESHRDLRVSYGRGRPDRVHPGYPGLVKLSSGQEVGVIRTGYVLDRDHLIKDHF